MRHVTSRIKGAQVCEKRCPCAAFRFVRKVPHAPKWVTMRCLGANPAKFSNLSVGDKQQNNILRLTSIKHTRGASQRSRGAQYFSQGRISPRARHSMLFSGAHLDARGVSAFVPSFPIRIFCSQIFICPE